MYRLKMVIKKIPKPLMSTIVYMFVVFFQSGINLVTTPLFSRILSTDEYGVVSTYNSWFSILLIFITLNLSSGVYNNALLEFEKDRDRMTSSFMTISIINSIIFLIALIFFKNCLVKLLDLPFILLVFMIVNCLLSSAWGFFIAREKFDYKYIKPLILTIISFVLNPICGYLGVILFPNSKSVAKIIGCLIPSLLIDVWLFADILLKGKNFFDKKYWKYALSFNIPLIPHYLSGIVLASSDRIMIQKIIGFTAAGIYGVAYQLSLVIQGVFTGINSALVPYTYKNLKAGNSEAVKKYAKYMLLFVSIVTIILALSSPEIIKILAPEEYYSAMYVVPAIVLGLYFSFIASIYGNIEFYYKKNKIVTIATTLSAVLNIILNIIFIPKCGFIAAGYTTFIGYLFLVIIHYEFLRFIKKSYIYDNKLILLISIVTSVIVFASIFVFKYIIIRIFLIGILFLIILKNIKNVLKFMKNV